ncbi:YqzL family protein [Mangrovibacillus cuniculi]|uniref:YqzL family protein n=1 Tax=Mangrovibacillus cuniculi TaxID=2593652 RepID=A0A7S8CBT9_9BACI|nr:YqzL family protein [Mangrovibacillus cuniculi]QPC46918.1 YqzL family protein [Mangrovibacillus cuniculi]
MLDLTWKVFSSTGDISTYLLYKELEQDLHEQTHGTEEAIEPLDFPAT